MKKGRVVVFLSEQGRFYKPFDVEILHLFLYKMFVKLKIYFHPNTKIHFVVHLAVYEIIPVYCRYFAIHFRQ